MTVSDAMVDRALDEMSLEIGEWRTLPEAELILRRGMVKAALVAALEQGVADVR